MKSISSKCSILEAFDFMDQARERQIRVEDAAVGKSVLTYDQLQQALLNGADFRWPVSEISSRGAGTPEDEAFDYAHVPVVVMAGGQGTRLHPLTETTPKPMIPIGNTTLADMMMDTFSDIGCKTFFVSLNYHADQIEAFYRENNPRGREYVFFREDHPLGSGGPLSLIKDRLDSTFIVGSCDIVLKQDFSKVMSYHRQAGNEITVVTALKRYKLTYGNMVADENQRLIRMEEKPEYLFRVNTAVYVMEPSVLSDMPYNEYLPITTLIDGVIRRKGRVGCFPISYGSWRDVGTWEDYDFMRERGLY